MMIMRTVFVSVLMAVAASGQEASVKPGVNEKFLDPELKVEEWTERFETESREIHRQREAIVKAVGIREGMVVADIGAGTGLFTMLFGKAAAPGGRVYAVEIAQKFVDHLGARAAKEKVSGVVPVLGTARSVELPDGVVDVAFICDVYHHFEYPADTMKSLWKAMKPGGTVVLIDFHRIAGKSSEWTMGHVRAGQEVFEREIAAAGFEKVGEEKGFLLENYFVRFRKKEKP
jgi:predicted methyltransferase